MSNFNELMHMAVRGFTDIEQLLEAFFGFLCTQTDFYHTQLSDEELSKFSLDPSVNRKGFKPEHMHKLLIRIFDRNLKLYRERNQPYLLGERQPQENVGTGVTISTTKTVTNVANCVSRSVGVSESKPMHYKNVHPSNEELPTSTIPASDVREILSTDFTIATWNGAHTDRYCWNQTFTDVTVEVVAREQLTSKDVKINITRDSMELSIRGLKVISGKFPHYVNSSESMWSIEDKRRIIISLDKPDEIWWDCLIQGDEKIDVTQIESVKRFSEFSSPQQGEMMKLIQQHQNKG